MTNQSPSPEKKKVNIKSVLTALASLKLTVVCLALLSILVIWGTIYQADHGLYQAQQKFFHSWFFLLFDFIPFPGTVLVMFTLFINLLFSMFFRIGFKLSKIGNIITHVGILILFVGGFLSFYYSEESSITMKEGETTNMSTSRTLWEFAVWEAKPGDPDIYAVDSHVFKPGVSRRFPDLKLQLTVKEYYSNCSAFTADGSPSESIPVLNSSGIHMLKEAPAAPEAEENINGGVFEIASTSAPGAGPTLLLYGEDALPTKISVNGLNYFFSLRKKKNPIPLQMTLVDFKMKMYPNSSIPKSYESKVTIKGEETGAVEREVVISMNRPLRFKEYTFFQSSYYIAGNGAEYTVLAVVKNAGRLVPYISSITIFLGLLAHFIGMPLRRRKKTGNKIDSQE